MVGRAAGGGAGDGVTRECIRPASVPHLSFPINATFYTTSISSIAPSHSSYFLSSLLFSVHPRSTKRAEQRAWEMAREQSRWDLVAINPGAAIVC
jgi:hypothetical protein